MRSEAEIRAHLMALEEDQQETEQKLAALAEGDSLKWTLNAYLLRLAHAQADMRWVLEEADA